MCRLIINSLNKLYLSFEKSHSSHRSSGFKTHFLNSIKTTSMTQTTQTQPKLLQPSLYAPEIVSSQQLALHTMPATQNVNHSTTGPRLFNRFILN